MAWLGFHSEIEKVLFSFPSIFTFTLSSLDLSFIFLRNFILNEEEKKVRKSLLCLDLQYKKKLSTKYMN
jgi:hypothetical protein